MSNQLILRMSKKNFVSVRIEYTGELLISFSFSQLYSDQGRRSLYAQSLSIVYKAMYLRSYTMHLNFFLVFFTKYLYLLIPQNLQILDHCPLENQRLLTTEFKFVSMQFLNYLIQSTIQSTVNTEKKIWLTFLF